MRTARLERLLGALARLPETALTHGEAIKNFYRKRYRGTRQRSSAIAIGDASLFITSSSLSQRYNFSSYAAVANSGSRFGGSGEASSGLRALAPGSSQWKRPRHATAAAVTSRHVFPAVVVKRSLPLTDRKLPPPSLDVVAPTVFFLYFLPAKSQWENDDMSATVFSEFLSSVTTVFSQLLQVPPTLRAPSPLPLPPPTTATLLLLL